MTMTDAAAQHRVHPVPAACSWQCPSRAMPHGLVPTQLRRLWHRLWLQPNPASSKASHLAQPLAEPMIEGQPQRLSGRNPRRNAPGSSLAAGGGRRTGAVLMPERPQPPVPRNVLERMQQRSGSLQRSMRWYDTPGRSPAPRLHLLCRCLLTPPQRRTLAAMQRRLRREARRHRT